MVLAALGHPQHFARARARTGRPGRLAPGPGGTARGRACGDGRLPTADGLRLGFATFPLKYACPVFIFTENRSDPASLSQHQEDRETYRD
jgi:hypothetical protein